MSENIIEIRNLTFAYIKNGLPQQEGVSLTDADYDYALRDVNLDIEKGSFLAVLGRNGSGKSTLAKCINGLMLPLSGDVLVKGYNTRDEEHLWDIRQAAGMVFQNPDNQLVSSIVEDDVAFGPENLCLPTEVIRERVDHALKGVNMYHLRKKAPHQLSGGQKQRVAIAGVIAMEPECIVFDEPTAMLDPKGRAEVMKIIRELHEKGITVVLITHFMEEAAHADRVVLMDEGKILRQGTPEEIFSDAEELKRAGLDVPVALEISMKLRDMGIPVPEGIIHRDELVDFICQYR